MSPRIDPSDAASSFSFSKVRAILGMTDLATDVRAPDVPETTPTMSESARIDPPPGGEGSPSVGSGRPHLSPAPPPEPAPDKAAASGSWWARLRHLVVHNILHLDDTPHRIAWGVFWGFLIGATPTIGLQVVIYLIVASLVGANRVSGILPIWLSNPITAIPLYYSEWFLGRFMLTGSLATTDANWAAIADAIKPRSGSTWWQRFFEIDLWVTVFQSFVAMGAELWLGSLVCGVLAGAAGYWFTYKTVVEIRKRRHHEAA
jgi:uncharacterized protein (DUF2062 family)